MRSDYIDQLAKQLPKQLAKQLAKIKTFYEHIQNKRIIESIDWLSSHDDLAIKGTKYGVHPFVLTIINQLKTDLDIDSLALSQRLKNIVELIQDDPKTAEATISQLKDCIKTLLNHNNPPSIMESWLEVMNDTTIPSDSVYEKIVMNGQSTLRSTHEALLAFDTLMHLLPGNESSMLQLMTLLPLPSDLFKNLQSQAKQDKDFITTWDHTFDAQHPGRTHYHVRDQWIKVTPQNSDDHLLIQSIPGKEKTFKTSLNRTSEKLNLLERHRDITIKTPSLSEYLKKIDMDCPAQFITLTLPQFLNEGMMPRTIHTGNIIQINDESIQLFSQVEIQGVQITSSERHICSSIANNYSMDTALKSFSTSQNQSLAERFKQHMADSQKPEALVSTTFQADISVKKDGHLNIDAKTRIDCQDVRLLATILLHGLSTNEGKRLQSFQDIVKERSNSNPQAGSHRDPDLRSPSP